MHIQVNQQALAAIIIGLSLAACSGDEADVSASANAAAGTAGLNVTEVADGIYVHTGVHAPFDADNVDDIANIGFIVGDDCVAVVDTGGSIAIGEALQASVRATTDIPVCYVINTHIHFDHVLGNLPFKTDDVTFVGHHRLPDALLDNHDFFIEEFGQFMGDDPAAAIIAPDTLVKDTLVLDLGGRSIELKAWPPAHTDSDLTIYDSATRTLWASDLLFMERTPALDASLRGWIAVMDELEQIPAERVIPGHGPASAPWPEALTDQRRYLTTLLNETRDAIQAGMFLDEALNTVGFSEQDNWELFDQHHRRNVTRAYSQLEWE